jgi:hypothetical protein
VSGVSSMGTFLVKGVASSWCFKSSSRSAWPYWSYLMMFWTLSAWSVTARSMTAWAMAAWSINARYLLVSIFGG